MQQAVDTFGRIDGVVCVAGILRERMLFNMSEEEWDPVIETHLKGTFTVFRAAAPIFRAAEERHDDRLHVGCVRGERRAGQLLGREGRHRLARPQRGRRHEQVRRHRELHRTGREVAHVGQRAVRPRDGRTRRRRADGRVPAAPTTRARSPARSTRSTAAASRCGTSRSRCARCARTAAGPSTSSRPRFDEVGQEPMPILDRLKEMESAAKSGDKPNQ